MAVRLKDRIEANIRQSDKVNNSLSIQLNSGTATVYNGSAAQSIDVTPAAIGAPSVDGTGASGTWNITSASTQRLLSPDTRSTSIIPTETLTGLVADFKAKGTVGITASGNYVGVLTWRSYSTAADLSGGQPIQIAYTQDNELQTRLGNTSTWGSWTKLLNSNNYTSYTVKKDGTGATGTWGINITGSSATCTGNAATATALTSSAGSTSRPIYFSSGKPAQITLTLPAAAITTGFDTTFRTSINGSTSTSPFLGVVRTDTASVTYAPQYGSGIVWGRGDTHGYLSVSYSGSTAYLGGGNADKLNWCKRIAFTDSNVASADKLKTARTISLTGAITGSGSFDGSSNLSITTSTPTNFKDLMCTKTVDLTSYSESYWYPFMSENAIPSDGMHYVGCVVHLNSGSVPSWSTHNAGFTAIVEALVTAGGWGTTANKSFLLQNNQTWIADTSNPPVGLTQNTNRSSTIFYLRGGGKYIIKSDWQTNWIDVNGVAYSSATFSSSSTYPGINITNTELYGAVWN